MKYYCTLFFSLFFLTVSYGQKNFSLVDAPDVYVNGQLLPFPFAGGINAAQIQSMDVTGNGQEEMVIWDRNSRRLLVFEDGESGLVYKPELQYLFPDDVNGYLVLVDYNGNGRKDLFTSSPFGIKAYMNRGHSNQMLQWEVAQNFLRLDGGSNVQANNLDIPVIMDIDGDGDLDIITFNFAVGDYLEYYRNTSIERKGSADIDGFAAARLRWGNFEFCGCGQFAFGFTCAGSPIQNIDRSVEENLRLQHIGGHSLLLYDFTGNGILDMVMGQDECDVLYFLPNSGTNESPVFTTVSTTLPGLGPLPAFPIFHVANLYKGNLIISLNASNRAQEYNIDFSRSLKKYSRGDMGWESSPADFLQNQMIDLGENARPFFIGNRTQGELLVTSNQLIDGQVTGLLSRFKMDQNGLTLLEEDFLNLSDLQLTDLQIQQSGNHFFYSGTRMENFVSIRSLFYNQGGLDVGSAQSVSIPEVSLRGNDHLEFFIFGNQTYLLLARQTGELLRYRVNFDPNPSFLLLDRNYLGFSDNPATRNLTVHVAQEASPHSLDLYAIDQRGRLLSIVDFMNQNKVQDELLIFHNGAANTQFGRNTWISSIPDILTGRSDLIMGTAAGGLIYLRQTIDQNPVEPRQWQLKLYPNPTDTFLTILSSEDADAQLVSPLGQVLINSISLKAREPNTINIQSYAHGLYYLRFTSNNGENISKKIIIK
ncbi:T9SS type A sorting domain-containing protein [Anditalea andensis]|uniref:Secretion system C-terminal sorting domain-containing protein n=1 Tax=Anditalea andensis TaxID=1048983 RepID=A0A074KV59_9BACT|nr:T9SS type A sorting domain-containing protein [Anditalea andensis]KEO72809.1 hypothetical protein EL17_14350 [Anditalea andensis]